VERGNPYFLYEITAYYPKKRATNLRNDIDPASFRSIVEKRILDSNVRPPLVLAAA
jgi:hypothetical protein